MPGGGWGIARLRRGVYSAWNSGGIRSLSNASIPKEGSGALS